MIGFFGRFMALKGFKYLVEATDIISKTRTRVEALLFWPLAGEDLFGRSRLKLSEKDWKHYFHFLPFQENPARAMKGVDVIVMPSLSEAYGIVSCRSNGCWSSNHWH